MSFVRRCPADVEFWRHNSSVVQVQQSATVTAGLVHTSGAFTVTVWVVCACATNVQWSDKTWLYLFLVWIWIDWTLLFLIIFINFILLSVVFFMLKDKRALVVCFILLTDLFIFLFWDFWRYCLGLLVMALTPVTRNRFVCLFWFHKIICTTSYCYTVCYVNWFWGDLTCFHACL